MTAPKGSADGHQHIRCGDSLVDTVYVCILFVDTKMGTYLSNLEGHSCTEVEGFACYRLGDRLATTSCYEHSYPTGLLQARCRLATELRIFITVTIYNLLLVSI
jgi:hypothetical protein